MGGASPAHAEEHPLHRPALGVPAADMDPRPVHLAAADHADPFRTPGDGFT